MHTLWMMKTFARHALEKWSATLIIELGLRESVGDAPDHWLEHSGGVKGESDSGCLPPGRAGAGQIMSHFADQTQVCDDEYNKAGKNADNGQYDHPGYVDIDQEDEWEDCSDDDGISACSTKVADSGMGGDLIEKEDSSAIEDGPNDVTDTLEKRCEASACEAAYSTKVAGSVIGVDSTDKDAPAIEHTPSDEKAQPDQPDDAEDDPDNEWEDYSDEDGFSGEAGSTKPNGSVMGGKPIEKGGSGAVKHGSTDEKDTSKKEVDGASDCEVNRDGYDNNDYNPNDGDDENDTYPFMPPLKRPKKDGWGAYSRSRTRSYIEGRLAQSAWRERRRQQNDGREQRGIGETVNHTTDESPSITLPSNKNSLGHPLSVQPLTASFAPTSSSLPSGPRALEIEAVDHISDKRPLMELPFNEDDLGRSLPLEQPNLGRLTSSAPTSPSLPLRRLDPEIGTVDHTSNESSSMGVTSSEDGLENAPSVRPLDDGQSGSFVPVSSSPPSSRPFSQLKTGSRATEKLGHEDRLMAFGLLGILSDEQFEQVLRLREPRYGKVREDTHDYGFTEDDYEYITEQQLSMLEDAQSLRRDSVALNAPPSTEEVRNDSVLGIASDLENPAQYSKDERSDSALGPTFNNNGTVGNTVQTTRTPTLISREKGNQLLRDSLWPPYPGELRTAYIHRITFLHPAIHPEECRDRWYRL